jgi:hypothetical protein
LCNEFEGLKHFVGTTDNLNVQESDLPPLPHFEIDTVKISASITSSPRVRATLLISELLDSADMQPTSPLVNDGKTMCMLSGVFDFEIRINHHTSVAKVRERKCNIVLNNRKTVHNDVSVSHVHVKSNTCIKTASTHGIYANLHTV